MFDESDFDLLLDFKLLEFASFLACSVRSRFERIVSRDEVDSVLRDVHVAKWTGPEVVLFPSHYVDFRVYLSSILVVTLLASMFSSTLLTASSLQLARCLIMASIYLLGVFRS